MEYILVSLFAMLLAVGTLSFLKKAFNRQISSISTSLGVEPEPIEIPFLSGQD